MVKTRKEAIAANLTRYWPVKPCKRGHVGEFDIAKGCLACVKEKRRKQHTARVLNGEWLPVLTDAIEQQRGVLTGLAAYIESDRLALLTAHVVTKPRHDNKSLSPLTVAQEITTLLDLKGTTPGDALLGMAESCGFIEITQGKRHGARQGANEIRLSLAAQAQRAQIEARLVATDIPGARPMLEPPPVRIEITRNWRGLEEAPLPDDPLPIVEALEPIQGTGWRVNQFMLDTLRKLVAFGEALDSDPDGHTVAMSALEQASYFADKPEFFYACNFDWRGRIYQRGGRLQYTGGTDAARSLLEFAHGERLTDTGRGFLGIHVATCYGQRDSIRDRMLWTHANRQTIAATVADPIGSTFWQGAKEPYRFLAAAHAWVNQEAPVHLPVTADATASAFQHFAWLLRDEELGARVNLSAAKMEEAPRDFYDELRTGTDYSRDDVKQLAFMIYGKVPRGAVDRDIQALLQKRAPRAWALYAALREAAGQEAKAGRVLDWTLPDGFKVRQAYRKIRTKAGTALWLSGWNGPWLLQARCAEPTDKLDPLKQRNGLPANLIHSLDACLLRAVVREAKGINQWAVAHDCIGVHPNYGTQLRRAIIEAVDCVYGPDLLAGIEVLTCGRVEHPAVLPDSMRGLWYTFS